MALAEAMQTWKLVIPDCCFVSLSAFIENHCKYLSLGDTDGHIHLYNLTTLTRVAVVDTKASAVITAQCFLKDRAVGGGGSLIVVGAANGEIVTFSLSRRQILSSFSLPSPITSLAAHHSFSNQVQFFAADTGGRLACYTSLQRLWVRKLSPPPAALAGVCSTHSGYNASHVDEEEEAEFDNNHLAVQWIISVSLHDEYGRPSVYILVSRGTRRVGVFSGNVQVGVLLCPAVPSSACVGKFVERKGMTELDATNTCEQVLLAGRNQQLYVVRDALLECVSYCFLEFDAHAVARIAFETLDAVAVCGKSNDMLIYQKGQLLHQLAMDDWGCNISCMQLSRDDGEKDGEVSKHWRVMCLLANGTLSVWDITLPGS